MFVVGRNEHREKARAYRKHLQLRKRFEARFARAIFGELKRVGEEASQVYLRHGMSSVPGFIDGQSDKVLKALSPQILSVYRLFWGTTRSGLFRQRREAEEQRASNLQDASVAYLQQHGARNVVNVLDHTKRRISRSIQEGVREGEGQNAIAERIRRGTSGEITRRRARVIARTETHFAATTAGHDALVASGLKDLYVMEWVSAEDARVRGSHLMAHGQRIKEGDYFKVGLNNTLLRYPGDPTGPAAEVINCRCISVVVPLDTLSQEERDIIGTGESDPKLPPPPKPKTPRRRRTRPEMLAAAQKEARDYVLDEGRKTGWEYVAVVDRNQGRVRFRGTSKRADQVQASKAAFKQFDKPDGEFEYYHNHPNAGPLSEGDLNVLFGWPGIKQMHAVARLDGHEMRFSAIQTKDVNWLKLNAIQDKFRDAFRKVASKTTSFDNWSWFEQLYWHHYRPLFLEDLGWLKYSYELPPRLQALFPPEEVRRFITEMRKELDL